MLLEQVIGLCSRHKPVVAIFEHASQEVSVDGFDNDMQVCEHFVGIPMADQFEVVHVNICAN